MGKRSQRLNRCPGGGRIPAAPARARLAELIEQDGGGEPVTLTRRGPGRKQAVLLPVEAAAVRQRHLAEQKAA
ncbi:hypothetical protein [Nonomuraea turcica]|uniref:hypothetical protein n=1 Tax=Nonomuraea sp. G32 TaxID=3067274 RepID=UPI00273B97F1|nr:hypothetical protein [Nonomuraea sp. G32]MDP4511505.1 hypothetical protein [Nonomuraea sp. G32]